MSLYIIFNEESSLHLHVADAVRYVLQVGVLQGLLSSDALLRVALQHLVKQVQALFVQGHETAEVLRSVLLLSLRLQGKLLVPRPVLLGGRAADLENFLELLALVLTREERLAINDLGKNATH